MVLTPNRGAINELFHSLCTFRLIGRHTFQKETFRARLPVRRDLFVIFLVGRRKKALCYTSKCLVDFRFPLISVERYRVAIFMIILAARFAHAI